MLNVSGYGGDGADALCAIREVGGVTIVQKIETAEQPDMKAATLPGCKDAPADIRSVGPSITPHYLTQQ
jgi:two-component system chemotaxis response regulator CheB